MKGKRKGTIKERKNDGREFLKERKNYKNNFLNIFVNFKFLLIGSAVSTFTKYKPLD